MADTGDEATRTDHTLVTAARDGSAEAFARLYRRHAPALLQVLTRQTGDRELAADLVQETFVDAWRSMDRLAMEQSFALWLYAIARNNRRAAARRARLRRFVPLEWVHRGVPSPSRDWAGETVAEADLQQRVLNDLSPVLREVLVLSVVGGFDTGEIAHVLHLTPAAVRQRLVRARGEFARRYRERDA